MVFETSPDVFLEAPLEVLRRLLSELQAGVLTGGGDTFKRLLESGYAFWGRCFLVLLLGSLKGALVGVRWCDEQSERRPDWGSDEGAIFVSKCILKVEYVKGAYIPGLETTCFTPEFRGFRKKMGFECNNSP